MKLKNDNKKTKTCQFNYCKKQWIFFKYKESNVYLFEKIYLLFVFLFIKINRNISRNYFKCEIIFLLFKQNENPKRFTYSIYTSFLQFDWKTKKWKIFQMKSICLKGFRQLNATNWYTLLFFRYFFIA